MWFTWSGWCEARGAPQSLDQLNESLELNGHVPSASCRVRTEAALLTAPRITLYALRLPAPLFHRQTPPQSA